MKLKFSLAFFISVLLMSGCVPHQSNPYASAYSGAGFYSGATKDVFYYADYDISLTKVDTLKKSSKQSITGKLKFDDPKISITRLPNPKQFVFVLENKLNHSIKILWDETVFVDENGGNHKIMHSGIKLTDRGNSQPPTVIIKGGKLEDLIYPIDYISWREGHYSKYSSSAGEWDEKPILPHAYSTIQAVDGVMLDPMIYGGKNAQQGFIERANSYTGKILKISLSLEDNGTKNEYLFTFKVNKVAIRHDV